MEETIGDNVLLEHPSLSVGGFKAFAELVVLLGSSTKTNDKLAALQQYFATANDKDKIWVIAIFTGRRPKRAVNSTLAIVWN